MREQGEPTSVACAYENLVIGSARSLPNCQSTLPVYTACLHLILGGSYSVGDLKQRVKQKVPSPLLRGGCGGDYGECLGCVGERVKRVGLVGAG